MSFTIRKGKPTDMPAVLELIKELAIFEKEPHAVIVTVNDLVRDGFGKSPLFEVFVAEQNSEIFGMCLFYKRYSTWKGVTLHLEDLIVKESMRSVGAGKALYRTFLEHAFKQQVQRVEWVVLDWNTNAINFYKNSGATVLEDWNVVQMSLQQIENFVQKNESI